MVLKNRATGYANGKPESSASMFVHMSLPFSAGSMYSTVDDMLLWSRALDANKLLNKKSTETLFTPVKDNYACGFVVGKKAERMRQGHGGAIPGFATALIRFPVTGLFVVGFSNADQRDIATTTSDLAAIAHGDKYELPKLPEPKAKPKDK
jgi:CubicO group peptidase (beta-lactamase class C family)